MNGVLLNTIERKRRAAAAFINDLGFHLILINEDRTPFANCAQCSNREGNERYVPHHGVKDCPHPASTCHGWQAGTNDLDQFLELLNRRPYAGIGIVNKLSNLVTVDCDTNHKGKAMPEAYQNISGIEDGEGVFVLIYRRYKVSWPTGCLETRTRNGGMHRTWRVPPGMWIKNSSDGSFGWLVDIKGSDCYVPAPGTVTKSGVYQRHSDLTNPEMAPEWLLHHLKITGHFPEPRRLRAPIKPVRLGPGSDGRAQGWVQEIADGLKAAPEGTGHDALLVATCQAAKLVLKGYITEDDARSAVYDAGSSRPRSGVSQRAYDSEFTAAWRSALTKAGGTYR